MNAHVVVSMSIFARLNNVVINLRALHELLIPARQSSEWEKFLIN